MTIRKELPNLSRDFSISDPEDVKRFNENMDKVNAMIPKQTAEEVMNYYVIIPSDMNITGTQIIEAMESYANKAVKESTDSILDDIEFGYDLSMIKSKIKNGDYE